MYFRKTICALTVILPFLFAQPTFGQRLTFAVLTIKNGSEVSVGETDIITDRLRVEIFKTGTVDVMEREQMQTILKEQGFQASGACTDEGCMVQMGQLLGVQFLVAGSIGRLGSLYLVNARSVNVKTGKIEKVVSVDIKGSIEDVVDELPRIARQLTSAEKSEPIVVYNESKQAQPTTAPPVEQSSEQDKHITSAASVNCGTDVVLQAIDFSDKISFTLKSSTTEDIHELIIDNLDDFFDRPVKVIPASQIAQLPADCRSPLVKVRMDSYSIKPSGTQFIGTATVSFLLFETVHSTTTGAIISIKESGDRHWGDQTPLVNAFEEIADRLEDQIDRSDYWRTIRKK